MNKLIIDKNYYRYQPQIILSEYDPLEISIEKYKTIYVFVDDFKLLGTQKLNKPNVVYVTDRDVVINCRNIEIDKIRYDRDIKQDFKKKIVNFGFIYEWLFGGKK